MLSQAYKSATRGRVLSGDILLGLQVEGQWARLAPSDSAGEHSLRWEIAKLSRAIVPGKRSKELGKICLARRGVPLGPSRTAPSQVTAGRARAWLECTTNGQFRTLTTLPCLPQAIVLHGKQEEPAPPVLEADQAVPQV